MPSIEQWALLLAPGLTPCSEEALDFASSTRDPLYEEQIVLILNDWPETTEPEYNFPPWLPVPEATPERDPNSRLAERQRLYGLVPGEVNQNIVGDDEIPF